MFRNALFISLAQQNASLIIEFLGLIILSRLLAPAEIGAYFAAFAFFAAARIVAEFGVHEYVVRNRTLSREVRQAIIFAIAAMSALSFALINGAMLTFATPATNDDFTHSLALLSIIILFQPLFIPQMALMHRHRRFSRILQIKLAGSLAQVAAAVAIAVGGAGAAALACGEITKYAIWIVGGLISTRTAFFVAPRFSNIRPILKFGGAVSAVGGIREIAEAGVSITVAGMLGFAAAGFLQRTRSVFYAFDRGFTEGIKPVLLPFLTARGRTSAQLREAYLKQVEYFSVVSWPAFGFIALYAEPIVLVILGDQWRGAAGLLRIICLAGAVSPFTALMLNYVIALGAMQRYIRPQIIIQTFKLALVGAMSLISLGWVCLSFFLADCAKAYFVQRILRDPLQLEFTEQIARASRSLAVTVGALIPSALLLLAPAVAGLPAFFKVGLGAAALGSGWIVMVFLSRHALAADISMLYRQLTMQSRQS